MTSAIFYGILFRLHLYRILLGLDWSPSQDLSRWSVYMYDA